MEEIDHERAGDRAGADSANDWCLARLFARLHRLHHPNDWCLARLFARLHRLHHPQQPPSEELTARERLLVQESARAAAQAVMREAVSTAIRTVAPDVAPERAPHVAQERARAMARAVLPPSVAGLFQDFMNPEPPLKSR